MSKLFHIYQELNYGTNLERKRTTCILEERTMFLRYVDFSKLCIVIKLFPELSINFLTNEITFPLACSERAIELRN